MEEVITLYEVYTAVNDVKELVSGDDLNSNGVIDTDSELLLEEIKSSLYYHLEDDEETAYSTLLSIRDSLESINQNLNKSTILLQNIFAFFLVLVAAIVLIKTFFSGW